MADLHAIMAELIITGRTIGFGRMFIWDGVRETSTHASCDYERQLIHHLAKTAFIAGVGGLLLISGKTQGVREQNLIWRNKRVATHEPKIHMDKT